MFYYYHLQFNGFGIADDRFKSLLFSVKNYSLLIKVGIFLTKSTPIVDRYDSLNRSSAKRSNMHDFPTPESPTKTILNKKSLKKKKWCYVIFIFSSGSGLIYFTIQCLCISQLSLRSWKQNTCLKFKLFFFFQFKIKGKQNVIF